MNPRTGERNDLFSMVCCPITGGLLVLNADQTRLISRDANLYFPVENGVPDLRRQAAKALFDQNSEPPDRGDPLVQP